MNGQPKPLFYVAVAAVVLGLVVFAAWRLMRTDGPTATHPVAPTDSKRDAPSATAAKPLPDDAKKKIVGVEEIANLGPAGEYKMQGDVVDCEISEWPGYAALVVANNGLEPNADSYFFKKHKFKLRLKVGEGESETWQALQQGKLGVSATTVDVLTLFGNQWKVAVPLQLDWSRGGDGLLTRKEISNINQLKGKAVTVARHTEAEFFLRFLAAGVGLEMRESAIGIKSLAGPDDARDPDKINLLYTASAVDAAEVFKASVANGDGVVSGAVTWSPWTIEIPKEMPDKVRLLVTNRNLLVIADILVVNAAFAKANPAVVKGLVEGVLWGVEEIRKNPAGTLPVAAKMFKDKPDLNAMKALMADVHLSNHAENLLFLSKGANQTGDFRDIYYQARYAYGDVVKSVVDPDRFIGRAALEQIEKDGTFAGQKVAIEPKKTKDVEIEGGVFGMQVQFRFEPDSVQLDLEDAFNKETLGKLTNLTKRALGWQFLLKGHMDTRRVDDIKAQGEAVYRKMAAQAVARSKQRADAVKAVLVDRYKIDADRIHTDGKGWEEPIPGGKPEENRRVEIVLISLE